MLRRPLLPGKRTQCAGAQGCCGGLPWMRVPIRTEVLITGVSVRGRGERLVRVGAGDEEGAHSSWGLQGRKDGVSFAWTCLSQSIRKALCFSAGPWKILLPFYWPISSSRDTVGVVVRDTPGFVSVPKSHAPHGFRPWAPQLFSPAPSHRICEEIGGGLLRLALPPSSSVAWDPHLLPPGCVLLFLSPCPVLGAVARA